MPLSTHTLAQRLLTLVASLVLFSVNTASANDTSPIVELPTHAASYDVFVDPNSGTFISKDQVENTETEQVATGKSHTQSKSVTVTDLATGGRMVDLRGHFKAKFNVHRETPTSPLTSNCRTEHKHHSHI